MRHNRLLTEAIRMERFEELYSELEAGRLDNTVRYKTLTLQIPPSPYRNHYVKTHVRVHHYPDDSMAIFHGPREIGRYSHAHIN